MADCDVLSKYVVYVCFPVVCVCQRSVVVGVTRHDDSNVIVSLFIRDTVSPHHNGGFPTVSSQYSVCSASPRRYCVWPEQSPHQDRLRFVCRGTNVAKQNMHLIVSINFQKTFISFQQFI